MIILRPMKLTHIKNLLKVLKFSGFSLQNLLEVKPLHLLSLMRMIR